MNSINGFRVFGTAVGSDQSIQLDEIVIAADPETIRAIGTFLTNAAYEMEQNKRLHVHLQDAIANFSYEEHVDIIAHVGSDVPRAVNA